MKLEVHGVAGYPELRADMIASLSRSVEGLGLAPVSGKIHLEDENGPKGGVALRCLIEVHLPRRPPADVSHVAESARLAFDGALEKIERRLAEDRARLREAKRRPKKFYAAKRALTGEERRRIA
jgi:hypothetical protein